MLLRREIGGLLPKAVALKDLVDLDEDTRQRLREAGIKTSKDLYVGLSVRRDEHFPGGSSKGPVCPV